MITLTDLTGQTFGHLTVTERSGSYTRKCGTTTATWTCSCDCGNTTTVRTDHLRAGYVQSCGNRRTHPARRRDQISAYNHTHRKVRRLRGPATAHNCQCGRPARHWAYRHTGVDEIATIGGWVYSPDPDQYEPMCATCHNTFDSARTRIRRIVARTTVRIREPYQIGIAS
jgi:hypothetical protein